MRARYNLQQRAALAIVPRLASVLIRCLGATLRFEDVVEPGATPAYGVPGPAVYAFWHRSLLTCAWRFRNWKIAILISQSFDGELIARTVERLGFVAVRGSSSRSGTTGLRGLERAYQAGHYCAITVDGPKGPPMVVKPGVVQLAHLVGSDVGAFEVMPERAWRLRSWDGFVIPKPFSRVIVTWPCHVTPERDAVQAALDRAVSMAEKMVRPS